MFSPIVNRVNDCISRVNNLDCTSVSKRMVVETIRSSMPVAHMVVRRRRAPRWSPQTSSQGVSTPPIYQTASSNGSNRVARWVHTSTVPGVRHGIALEAGVYISRISESSKDSGIVVGDRVLRVSRLTRISSFSRYVWTSLCRCVM